MRRTISQVCTGLLPLAVFACKPEYDLVGEPDIAPEDVTECGFTRIDGTALWGYDCNPVFTGTDEGWAQTIDATAFVVTPVLGHPFYQLWYTGLAGAEATGDYGLGYAISPDGTTWTPAPDNPLLTESPPAAWDHTALDVPQVVWDEATAQYVMVYQGYNLDTNDWGLGVATSMDGRAWTRLPQNPVVDFTAETSGVTWCWPLGLSLGSVTGYTAYVAGVIGDRTACEAHVANAADLADWSVGEDVAFRAGQPGTWDDEGQVSLATAELDGTHYLFYVGFGGWDQYDGYRVTKNHFLGLATSTDGTSFEREPDPLPVHNSDEGLVTAVAANRVGSRIHLWVTDDWGGVQGVGYFLFDPARAAEEDQ